MNVLFVHETDWLNKVVFDIHSLSESLSLLGHQVYAIDYENTWGRNGRWRLSGLKTREIKGVSRAFAGSSVCLRRPGFIRVPGLSRLSAGLSHCLEIQRTIKEQDIEAIVLYGLATNGLQTTYLARKFRVPVVFRSIDILNQLVPYPALRPLTRFLERRVYSKVDYILTLTPSLSKYVVELGAEASRVEVLPMPVDTGLFHPQADPSPIRQKWALDKETPVIVFIGTLFDFSGLDTFIEKFPELLGQVPAARLLIVGDGPQRGKLEGIIDKRGLSRRVTITGFEPYHTMPQYINLATVCINTFSMTDATRDIFPGKIVQYLACARAVVATALPGLVAVIPGEEQGIAYCADAPGMIRETISLLKSEERRQRLERNGFNYVKRVHSHVAIARQLEAKLQEVIEEKRNEGLSKRV